MSRRWLLRAVHLIILVFFLYSQVGCNGCYFFVKIEDLDKPAQDGSSQVNDPNGGNNGDSNSGGGGNSSNPDPSPATSISALPKSTYVDLAWVNTSAPLYYTISYGTLSGQTTNDVASPVFQNYFTIQDLSEQTTYYLVVKSHFANNVVLVSDEISFSTPIFTCNDFLTNSTYNSKLTLKGNGTEESPYIICNAYQMQTLSLPSSTAYLDKVFKLEADIDMSVITNPSPIGTTSAPFTGFFQGNNHTISHFHYSSTVSINHVGLFGVISKAKINKLNLDDFQVQGHHSLSKGALVGSTSEFSKIEDITIDNSAIKSIHAGGGGIGGLIGFCYCGLINLTVGSNVQIEVHPDAGFDEVIWTGGVVGRMDQTTFFKVQNYAINIVSSAKIIGGQKRVGGIIGFSNGRINNNIFYKNTFNGTIESNPSFGGNSKFVGGLIGHSTRSLISHSVFSGTITGGTSVGGLIGEGEGLGGGHKTRIYHSRSIGQVTGNFAVGGLIGNCVECEVQDSMSSTLVSGNGSGYCIGGLVGGSNYVNIDRSYFDGQIQNTSTIIGIGGAYGCMTSSVFTNSYVKPQFINSGTLGGLIGWWDSGTLTNVYWDKEFSNVNELCGTTSSYNCNSAPELARGLLSSELTDPAFLYSTSSNDANWSFYGENDAPYNVPNDFWIQNQSTLYPDLFWHGYDPVADSPFGVGQGSGTEADPYKLDSADDLNLVSQNLELLQKNYFLNTSELNVSTGSNAFKPWGDFLGKMESNFRLNSIRYYNLNLPGQDNVGFISGIPAQPLSIFAVPVKSIENQSYFVGYFKKMSFMPTNLSGRNHVGVISGSTSPNYIFDDILVIGTPVVGTGTYLGGFAAHCFEAKNLEFMGRVQSTGKFVGGYCGTGVILNGNNNVTNGSVTGSDFVGGAFGIASTYLGVGQFDDSVKINDPVVTSNSHLTLMDRVTSTGSIAGFAFGSLEYKTQRIGILTFGNVLYAGSRAGSIAGQMKNSEIKNSYIFSDIFPNSLDKVHINATGNSVGGLVGYVERDTGYHGVNYDNLIESSYVYPTQGTIGGSAKNVGGLVGEVTKDANLTISHSYYDGDIVSSGSVIGGLVGLFSNNGGATSGTNIIIDSYSRAKINGTANTVAGVVGKIQSANNVQIKNTYFAGVNSCSGSQQGAFVSVDQNSSVTSYVSNFWDLTLNPTLNDLASGSIGDANKISSQSTTAMTTTSTLYENKGWDFSTIWVTTSTINNGYPTLK